MTRARSNNPHTFRPGPFHMHAAFISKKSSGLSHISAYVPGSIRNILLGSSRASVGDLLIKPILDVFAAIIALVLLGPLMLIISLLIKIDSPGSILFLQQRVGKNGKYFTIFKFRTLYVEHFGILIDQEAPHDYSVTPIGKYLRRYKLDEIPQFINVILGNMSIVGPRPDISIQVNKYIASQHERLLVKPGLTGISQVSGNTMLTWAERITLDIWYIQNRTCLLDIKIIAHTLVTIIKGETLSTDPFQVHRLLAGRKICA